MMKTGADGYGRGESRRAFLKKTVAAAATAGAGLLPVYGRSGPPGISLVLESGAVVTAERVQWALQQLRDALAARGLMAQTRHSLAEAPAGDLCLLIAGPDSSAARQVLAAAGLSLATAPESLALVRGDLAAEPGARRQPVLLATGSEALGLVYAVLELVDRVRFAADPVRELQGLKPVAQQPANRVRSIARLFASDVEDKPWFDDRSFWPRYLTELATQRFNRFSLMLGLGYDFTTDIHDAYFHFAYPFLITVPGYSVRAVPLPAGEVERNLEQLRFISEETVRRGLRFQLGLWTHAYKWIDSPNANYVIEGLTPENHAAYCRDALAALLRACPAISGVTIRIHGESGVAEGSYEFWQTLFDGVARCGRPVGIDLHAKGIDERMINLALATGMPVTVSPKFWAEHLGLGYMQGAIRPQELPPREERDSGFFAMSSGSRRFLRYGYGDLLREDRRYEVVHRVWPGTQRLLLWGDPALAADYGRAMSFCGSAGVEWCEPLSFKGRKGSGLPGGRTGYADPSLPPAGGDFEKYLYTYRLLGRRAYDPQCAPEEWRRFLDRDFGRAAPAVEQALGAAGRILPLVTTAHCPSAANNNYWPEMYTNMAIVDAKRPHPYSDTLSPKRFGTVSALDPEFFSRVEDFADELLHGKPRARYSPVWVAESLEQSAASAAAALKEAARKTSDPRAAEFRRLAADVAIQSGLGRFFAWKLRAAVLFALYERTHFRPALEQALVAYRQARGFWMELAEGAKPIYRSDVAFGPGKFQRGHWLDRLPAIDADLGDMEKELLARNEAVTPAPADVEGWLRAISLVLGRAKASAPPGLQGFHQPPPVFRRGEPLVIEASLAGTKPAPKLGGVRLRFRRVNQSEPWQAKEMDALANSYRAVIPADYTDSPFPLQYHFELHDHSGEWFFPGLKPGWQGQPYFIVRQKRDA